MIGYSLSLCIADLIRGWVKIEEVERIVAGTNAQTENDWERTVSAYSKNYWEYNPQKAAGLVATLRAAGKIDQPRTRGEDPPPPYKDYHWTKDGAPFIIKK